jgi:predicted permease
MDFLYQLSLMGALIALGHGWRYFSFGGIEASVMRRMLTSVVFVYFLPALALHALWSAPRELVDVRIPLISLSMSLSMMLVTWLIYRSFKLKNAQLGALILACGFANTIYLGIPVLQGILGPIVPAVVMQFDFFASTPLLFSLGILIAVSLGTQHESSSTLKRIASVPALWAAALGLVLNLSGQQEPAWVGDFLSKLGSGVSVLMLIAVGMALNFKTLHPRNMPLLLPAVVIQLILMPLFVWMMAMQLGMSQELLNVLVLAAAMPTMVLGMVLCDKYGLDSELFVATITITTLLTFVTLPFWGDFLSLTPQ